MIKVLIVDDSATTRELVKAILGSQPDFQIVGEAADGLEAVELTAQLAPDVITMDVNMPRLNGYQATQQIMRTNPTPIVVLTTLTMRDMIQDGLNMLLAGALDIVEKPSALTARDHQMVGEELIRKVRDLSQVQLPR